MSSVRWGGGLVVLFGKEPAMSAEPRLCEGLHPPTAVRGRPRRSLGCRRASQHGHVRSEPSANSRPESTWIAAPRQRGPKLVVRIETGANTMTESAVQPCTRDECENEQIIRIAGISFEKSFAARGGDDQCARCARRGASISSWRRHWRTRPAKECCFALASTAKPAAIELRSAEVVSGSGVTASVVAGRSISES